MNIIRTMAVELSSIPAIAYKQKLASGGTGVKLFRLDQDATAIFTINVDTEETAPLGRLDRFLFPIEAVDEALDLTRGLPYDSRHLIKAIQSSDTKDAEDVEDTEQIDMVNSLEYKKIVERYLNEKGKMSYALMNKDFIQFASKSKIVKDMAMEHAQLDEILIYIMKNRAANLSGNKDTLSDQEATLLLQTLHEINPHTALKDLTAYLKRLLAKVKN